MQRCVWLPLPKMTASIMVAGVTPWYGVAGTNEKPFRALGSFVAGNLVYMGTIVMQCMSMSLTLIGEAPDVWFGTIMLEVLPCP